jgi:hypothetical protein|tara:strand:+ start:10961 stop:11890 length:930 start_codon:yes stop_codon:yes gene_type:complete
MSTFAQLKKSNDNLSRLLTEVDKVNTPQKSNNSNADERFWRPELDKSGNGYAVIRFLPEAEGEELPWVRIFNHGFQGPTGKWYIENSLTTLNQKDPVAEHNSVLWNSGTEANKDIARKQKRRLSYIANVLVVSDPKHPENEGKVKLFKFGKKIFDKIMDQMKPQFEDESPVNPFDPWKGTNFKLKIRKVEGFTNYDKSEFDSSSNLFEGDDAKIEALWKSQYKLSEFLASANFKSYDELSSKLNLVLNLSQAPESFVPVQAPITPRPVAEKAPWVAEEKSTTPEVTQSSGDKDEDDEAMSYFSKLASDD